MTTHTNTYYVTRSAVRFAFVCTIALLAFVIGREVTTNTYQYSCDGQEVTAVLGDTLWSLAEQHCTGHIGSAVDDLYDEHKELQYGDKVIFNRKRK